MPVLRNLVPAQVLAGKSSFNTGNSISAGLPVYARNQVKAIAGDPRAQVAATRLRRELVACCTKTDCGPPYWVPGITPFRRSAQDALKHRTSIFRPFTP